MAHANGGAKLSLRKNKGLMTTLVCGNLLIVGLVPEHKAFCLISGQFREQVSLSFRQCYPNLVTPKDVPAFVGVGTRSERKCQERNC